MIETPILPDPSPNSTMDIYNELKERHGTLKSVAKTEIVSHRDGVIVVSTVIKGAGHDSSDGFYMIFETLVLGGDFQDMAEVFTTAGSRRIRLKEAILKHNSIVERVVDFYLL